MRPPASWPVRALQADAVDPPDRAQELARLGGFWPAELADVTREGRARLVAKLENLLKAERRRGRAGHWAYDLAQHVELLRALRRERAILAALPAKMTAAHKTGAA